MIRLEQLESREVPAAVIAQGITNGTIWTATAANTPGEVAVVEVHKSAPGPGGDALIQRIQVFPDSFVTRADGTGGVLITSAHLTADAGGSDILLAAPAQGSGGGGVLVRFAPLTGVMLGGEILLPDPYRNGLSTLACTDANHDGTSEAYAMPAAGGGPVVVGIDVSTGAIIAAITVGDPADRSGKYNIAPAGLGVAMTSDVSPATGKLGVVIEYNHDPATSRKWGFDGLQYDDVGQVATAA